MIVRSNVVEGFKIRSSTLRVMLKPCEQPLISIKCISCVFCLWCLLFANIPRILGFTLVSFVFNVTVESQPEEEQYEVAEHDYAEEQDQGQYFEQGKPTSPL